MNIQPITGVAQQQTPTWYNLFQVWGMGWGNSFLSPTHGTTVMGRVQSSTIIS